MCSRPRNFYAVPTSATTRDTTDVLRRTLTWVGLDSRYLRSRSVSRSCSRTSTSRSQSLSLSLIYHPFRARLGERMGKHKGLVEPHDVSVGRRGSGAGRAWRILGLGTTVRAAVATVNQEPYTLVLSTQEGYKTHPGCPLTHGLVGGSVLVHRPHRKDCPQTGLVLVDVEKGWH
jgi:hypothetical protein